jgi:hypothetical protein
MKVQSASLHFFLGSEDEQEDSDDEDEAVSPFILFYFAFLTKFRVLTSKSSYTDEMSTRKLVVAIKSSLRQ